MLAVRNSGEAPRVYAADLITQRLADVERRMADLRATRTALRMLSHRAQAADPCTCIEADICRIITSGPCGGSRKPR